MQKHTLSEVTSRKNSLRLRKSDSTFKIKKEEKTGSKDILLNLLNKMRLKNRKKDQKKFKISKNSAFRIVPKSKQMLQGQQSSGTNNPDQCNFNIRSPQTNLNFTQNQNSFKEVDLQNKLIFNNWFSTLTNSLKKQQHISQTSLLNFGNNLIQGNNPSLRVVGPLSSKQNEGDSVRHNSLQKLAIFLENVKKQKENQIQGQEPVLINHTNNSVQFNNSFNSLNPQRDPLPNSGFVNFFQNLTIPKEDDLQNNSVHFRNNLSQGNAVLFEIKKQEKNQIQGQNPVRRNSTKDLTEEQKREKKDLYNKDASLCVYFNKKKDTKNNIFEEIKKIQNTESNMAKIYWPLDRQNKLFSDLSKNLQNERFRAGNSLREIFNVAVQDAEKWIIKQKTKYYNQQEKKITQEIKKFLFSWNHLENSFVTDRQSFLKMNRKEEWQKTQKELDIIKKNKDLLLQKLKYFNQELEKKKEFIVKVLTYFQNTRDCFDGKRGGFFDMSYLIKFLEFFNIGLKNAINVTINERNHFRSFFPAEQYDKIIKIKHKEVSCNKKAIEKKIFNLFLELNIGRLNFIKSIEKKKKEISAEVIEKYNLKFTETFKKIEEIKLICTRVLRSISNSALNEETEFYKNQVLELIESDDSLYQVEQIIKDIENDRNELILSYSEDLKKLDSEISQNQNPINGSSNQSGHTLLNNIPAQNNQDQKENIKLDESFKILNKEFDVIKQEQENTFLHYEMMYEDEQEFQPNIFFVPEINAWYEFVKASITNIFPNNFDQIFQSEYQQVKRYILEQKINNYGQTKQNMKNELNKLWVEFSLLIKFFEQYRNDYLGNNTDHIFKKQRDLLEEMKQKNLLLKDFQLKIETNINILKGIKMSFLDMFHFVFFVHRINHLLKEKSINLVLGQHDLLRRFFPLYNQLIEDQYKKVLTRKSRKEEEILDLFLEIKSDKITLTASLETKYNGRAEKYAEINYQAYLKYEEIANQISKIQYLCSEVGFLLSDESSAQLDKNAVLKLKQLDQKMDESDKITTKIKEEKDKLKVYYYYLTLKDIPQPVNENQ